MDKFVSKWYVGEGPGLLVAQKLVLMEKGVGTLQLW
jgi:hypothetical protein